MRSLYQTTCLAIVISIATLSLQAQPESRTIQVTGTATVNVSPNEIILEIRYQEYFEGEEAEENRITIDQIEAQVLKALGKAEVEDDKITLGGISVVRPSFYQHNERIFLKRRLSKTLVVCVATTDELLNVVRQLEAAKLMDEVITDFEIVETKNTEIEDFKKQVKVDAFKDAREKAELILSTSTQKPGAVLSIKELPKTGSPSMMGVPSTYGVVETPAAAISGFKPIQVTYRVEVMFEID